MSTTISVIFVDDEPLVLDGLRRQLRSLSGSWDMRFAVSGAEAIAMMDAQPADAIVTDMRMPGMNGVQLLEHAHSEWPQTARIILSGQTDQTDMLSDVGVIHQFLQKPCDAETLRRSICRATSVTRLIETPHLRRVVSGLRSLPVLAQSLQELLRALQDGRCDIAHVSDVVSRDVGLSTKLLQLVNSAFFGNPRRISNVKDAVSLIGLNTLRQIAVAARTFDALSPDSDDSDRSIETLWLKSSDLAAIAARLARSAGQAPEVQARARLAASVSLVGIAVIARYLPGAIQQALAEADAAVRTFDEALTAIIGVRHELIGAYALGLWAFEDDIIRAVTFQADPEPSGVTDARDPLLFLHMARCQAPQSAMISTVTPSQPFLDRLGVISDSVLSRSTAA